MKSLLTLLFATLGPLFIASAHAQGPAQLGPNQYWGNPGSLQGLARPMPMPHVLATSQGAKCDGITDDATKLQAVVDALPSTGGIIYTPPGSTCLTSSILTINKSNVTLSGASVKNEKMNGASKWVYTGTAARFIDARDSFGFHIEGMQITYSSSSFAGILIDLGTSASAVSAYSAIRNSSIGTSTGRTGTATLVGVTASVNATIEKVYFYHGAPSILGQTVAGQNVRTTIKDSTFAFSDAVTISSCGESWIVSGNSFEPQSNGSAQAFSNISTLPCLGGVWSGNWFGDVTNDIGTWIDGYFQGTVFVGNRMSGPLAVVNTQGIKLHSSTASFSGNNFNLLAVGINCVSSNQGVTINGGNLFPSVTTPIGNPSGCSNLNSDGNSPSTSQVGSGQVLIGQTSADPAPKTISGDCTLSSLGAVVCTKFAVRSNSESFASVAVTNPTTTSYSADASAASNQISVTAAGNQPLVVGSGFHMIYNTGTGGFALFFVGGAATTIFSGSSAEYVVSTTPAASKTGLSYDGSTNYRIYNGFGSTQSYKLFSVRLSSAN